MHSRRAKSVISPSAFRSAHRSPTASGKLANAAARNRSRPGRAAVARDNY
jgi:hypothetical protein